MKLGKWLKKIFNPRPIDGYVSEVDKFLEKYDQEHSEEAYAARERKKHERIFYLRDNRVKQDINEKIWKGF